MFRYQCLNPISRKGLDRFTGDYERTNESAEADAILVRSASMHDVPRYKKLKAIARAGAGVNNIPIDQCTEEGIVVFNTPGANANGVKELVIAGLLLASRDIVGGINWTRENAGMEDIAKQAEKVKKEFAGYEIQGKKLGIIGLGAIGVLVANAATSLGMSVYGYDPFISVDAAWNLSRSIVHIQNVEDIYRHCDYITVHVPLLDDTREMINAQSIRMMRDRVTILNFSRDKLVNEADMIKALESGKVKRYVTDFATPAIAKTEHAIVMPHMGASTAESEENCAKMAVKELMDYLENGNISNSVNYPNCDMGRCTKAARIAINHRNVPHMIGNFTSVLSTYNINISDMTNKSRGDYAYTMFDLEEQISDELVEKIRGIDGVLKTRVIKGTGL